MKPISITCIICGTFAFMFPMVYQLAHSALVAYALANTHFSTITLEPLDTFSRIGSLLFGLCLTGIGISSGVFNRSVATLDAERKSGVLPLVQPSNA